MKGGGGRTRWEKGEEVTKEGIKGGGGYCVQVSGSHWSAESDPLRGRDSGSVPVRLGTEAAAASGWGPVGKSS